MKNVYRLKVRSFCFMLRRGVCQVLICALVFTSISQIAAAQVNIPLIILPDASAKSAMTFGAILAVHEFENGKVLVNDGRRLQLMLVEPQLDKASIALDSTRGISNFYGGIPTPLTPYLGDSVLFANALARTVSVIDSRGVVARSLALPQGAGLPMLKHGGVDDKGRIYLTGNPPIIRRSAPGGVPPLLSDSTPLLRADLATRAVDTIAWVERPFGRFDGKRGNGQIMSGFRPDPLRAVDDWSVMSDGTLAIVKGHDYHVDYLHSDGTRTSSSKLPFDWRQLDEKDKQKVIDDAQADFVAAAHNNSIVLNLDIVINWSAAPSEKPLPAGTEHINLDVDTVGALYTIGANGPVMMLPRAKRSVDEVFDYYPPVRNGSAMSDLENHLWILPTTSKQSKAGELVYDVVTNKGVLLTRVRIPVGRSIVGFGRHGVVYLTTGSLANGFTLEKSKLPNALPNPK